ncbi:hemicentin-1-like isoform X1 [Pomacea canaliculata]|uniref:hemicentin-1-like isoform X1 n=1 Tax=Pomacea canaliculata TaxID=400727 RepID=UPI000D72BFF6|nr:hemicentin-1-like isoform X1 [Pomacea canaliculata]
MANNDYGSDRVFAYLEITVAPIIFKAPKNQTVTAGENINFTCEAQGNPTPHVVWLKNGVRIKTELTALGVLMLEKVTLSDAGVYTCLAESPEGQISSSVSLNVLFAPEIDSHPADEIVLIGSSFSLSCKVTGNPVPSMQWILPNSVILQKMSFFENATVDQTGTLLVTAVTPEYQGHYTCYAWNSLGYSTAIAFITVEGPPYFKVQPASQTVLLGNTANLSCQAGSYPIPTVSWFHGDQVLLPGSQIVISSLGDLTIHEARLEDGGQYTCVAENFYGSLNTSAILSIHVLPVFVVAPSSMAVTFGQTVTLKCEVTGVPTPTQKWIRSGRTLLLGNNMIIRPDNTLVIANITHKDLGQYTCLARNEAGEKSATASIYLPGWPFFVASERNITVNISEPLNISCHAQQSGDGEGVIHAVRWYRGCCNAGNDTLIPCTEGSLNNETDSIHIWSTNHGDLYFQQVLEADEGWYYCAADNEGDAVYSDPVYINVQVSPRITNVTNVTPGNNQTSLQIMCLAVGDPDPLVIWRSPIGQERGDRTDLADGVQSVVKVTNVSDSGQWICKACNILGCAFATITLDVEGSPVIIDVLSESSDGHVTITCQVAGFPSPDIYYYISNGTDVTTLPSHTVEAGHLMVMASALQEAYTCTAKNIHGASSLLLTKPLTHPWIIHTVSSATEISLTFNISGSLGALPLKALLIAYKPVLKMCGQ